MLPNDIAINIKEDAMGFLIIPSLSKPPCPVIRAARLIRGDHDASPTSPNLFVSADLRVTGQHDSLRVGH
jgi:hypothetical protein